MRREDNSGAELEAMSRTGHLMEVELAPLRPHRDESTGGAAELRTTCLINHFEYGEYVVEALRSAVKQHPWPFDEIIVVDDGSRDGSLEVLRAECALHPNVRLVEKENGGQLSAFRAGFEASTGDLIFFLDADDTFEPDYLEGTLGHFRAHPECDCAISAYRRFGASRDIVQVFEENTDLGFAVVLAHSRSLKKLTISPTSTMCLRRWVLERILPVPDERDWRLRADDCLVYGAALAGARKSYLAEPRVGYRVHDKNGFHGRVEDADYSFRRRLGVERLFVALGEAFGQRSAPTALATREFKTIERPGFGTFRNYAKLVLRDDTRLSTKVRLLAGLSRHYAATRFGATPVAPESPTPRGHGLLIGLAVLLGGVWLWILLTGGGEPVIFGKELSMTSSGRPFVALLAVLGAIAWRDPRTRPTLRGWLRAGQGSMRGASPLRVGAQLLLVATFASSLLTWIEVPDTVAAKKRLARRSGLITHGDHGHLREVVGHLVAQPAGKTTAIHIAEGDARAHLSAYYAYPRLLVMSPEVRRWSLRERMVLEGVEDPVFEAAGEPPPVELSRDFAERRGVELLVIPGGIPGSLDREAPGFRHTEDDL